MNDSIVRLVIITVPKGIIFRKLSGIIHQIKEVGETFTAASYPPHVTLRTGVMVPKSELDHFIQDFRLHIGQWQPFEIQTDGIQSEAINEDDERKFFIYYRIKNNPMLEQLNRHLLEYRPYIKSRKTEFRPHLSLAYDDLSQIGFKKVKSLLVTNEGLFPRSLMWKCDNISLYLKQEGKWVPFRVFNASDYLVA